MKNNFYLNKGSILLLSFFILNLFPGNYLFPKENQDLTVTKKKIKEIQLPYIQHIGLNVNNPVEVANWYIQNLGMKLIRQGNAPQFVTFIADAGNNMEMEFYNKEKIKKIDFQKIDVMTFHFAFLTDSINTIENKLIAAGAKLIDKITETPAGDKVAMLRDPWGMPLQLVERSIPMIKYTSIRPEHLALNSEDARTKSKWYANNFKMEILRQSGAPEFGCFLIDANKDMMLEIYQKKDFPIIDFHKVDPKSIHLAFEVKDIKAIKKDLLKNGAQLIHDITLTKSGENIMTIRDPWGFPIQLLQKHS